MSKAVLAGELSVLGSNVRVVSAVGRWFLGDDGDGAVAVRNPEQLCRLKWHLSFPVRDDHVVAIVRNHLLRDVHIRTLLSVECVRERERDGISKHK